MHQEMMGATKVVVGATQYVVLSCGQISRVDYQSWLFIHCYVVQNWVKVPILISLDKVLEGSDS
jgi:hypothetical protein